MAAAEVAAEDRADMLCVRVCWGDMRLKNNVEQRDGRLQVGGRGRVFSLSSPFLRGLIVALRTSRNPFLVSATNYLASTKALSPTPTASARKARVDQKKVDLEPAQTPSLESPHEDVNAIGDGRASRVSDVQDD